MVRFYKRKKRGRKRKSLVRRKLRTGTIRRGITQRRYMIKKTYTETATGTTASSINIALNTAIDKITNFAEMAAVFEYFRINKVSIKICSPTNIGQSSINSLFQIYYKKKQEFNETAPTTEGAWGEIQAKQRKIFTDRNNNTVSLYFTPFQWHQIPVAPGSANTRDIKLYKQWYKLPTVYGTAVNFNGPIATIMAVDGSAIPTSAVFKIYTTVYMEMRGII